MLSNKNYSFLGIYPMFLIVIILFLISCSLDNEKYFNSSKFDIREKVFISEIHWAGSIKNDASNFNPDDDFVELKNDSYSDINISGWALVLEGGQSFIISIPSNSIIKSKGFYVIGNNTNGAFKYFDFISKNLKIPNTGFIIKLKDGTSRVADNIDFYNYDKPPAGFDYPLLKKSMIRKISYFGAEEGSNPYNWNTFNLFLTSTNINNDYSLTVFCSPGEEYESE